MKVIIVTQTIQDIFDGSHEKYPRKLKKKMKYTKMSREQLQKRNILGVCLITHHILKNGKREFYRKPKVIIIRTEKQLHSLYPSKNYYLFPMGGENENNEEFKQID